MNNPEKYDYLLSLIDWQESLIIEQNKTIKRLVNQTSEQENMIEVLTKGALY